MTSQTRASRTKGGKHDDIETNAENKTDYGANDRRIFFTARSANNYITDKEYCLYFRKGGYCQPQSYEDAKTVFNEPINQADKKLFAHPTIKPLKFITTMIKNSSKPGDVILDPFMGSGTTASAAKELGRRFIGFENNLRWHKVACDRLNGIDATGQMGFILR